MGDFIFGHSPNNTATYMYVFSMTAKEVGWFGGRENAGIILSIVIISSSRFVKTNLM